MSPPPPWCYRPNCPQLWAATFSEQKVCLVRSENEQIGTHGLPCVTMGAICKHYKWPMSTRSWSLLKLRGLGQLVFVKTLISHSDWWLGCVRPQNGTRVLSDGDTQTRRFHVSIQYFSSNRYLCWLQGGNIWTWEQQTHYLRHKELFSSSNIGRGHLFSNVCTFCYAHIEPGWMDKNTKHCLSKDLEFGPCSSINSDFLLLWVQLFQIWAKCLLLWLYVLQFKQE